MDKCLKRRILLFINLTLYRLITPCRMYDRKPKRPESGCYLCAMRGGWLRCRRSRQLPVSVTADN
jgi:hypothetical protein